MTKHASGLRVVFTGSSRTKLAHVFSNANAPLQKALGRLADKNVEVKTPRGTFEFEHEAFAAWVRNIAN